jgi:hypothetical protein
MMRNGTEATMAGWSIHKFDADLRNEGEFHGPLQQMRVHTVYLGGRREDERNEVITLSSPSADFIVSQEIDFRGLTIPNWISVSH